MTEDTERQAHLKQLTTRQVIIIGCGGTGSHMALTMAKLGVETIHLIDYDTVEEENIRSQMYGPVHKGQKKTHALKQLLIGLAGTTPKNIKTYSKYNEETLDEITIKGSIAYIISCVDSNESRAEIYETTKQWMWKNKKAIEHTALYSLEFYDIRVGRDEYNLYMKELRPEEPNGNKDNYLKTLSGPTSNDPCNAKISYTTNALAAQRVAGRIIRGVTMGVGLRTEQIKSIPKDRETATDKNKLPTIGEIGHIHDTTILTPTYETQE